MDTDAPTRSPEDESPDGGSEDDSSVLTSIFDDADQTTGRRWLRVLVGIVVTLALLVGAAWLGTAVLRVPPPWTLVKLQLTAPSDQGTLFPARAVPADGATRAFPDGSAWQLPETVPWRGEQRPVADFLDETHTRAFVVLQDGHLVEEWYAAGTDASTRLSSWSVAKSMVSLLVGQSIAAGRMSEDDTLVDLLPDFRVGSRSRYDTITVRDLLDMSAAVDVSENYNEWWPFTGTARLFLSTDLKGYLRDHRKVTDRPGTTGDYRSVETQLLAMALVEVEGKPLADLFAERIWGPVGAEHDATWNLDSPGGIEKGFCCVNATALDFARVGQMVAEGGRVEGTQVVPRRWIDRLRTPAEHPLGDWDYSGQWWHPTGNKLDLMAIGIHGQYIYVNPHTGTVIVKLSDHGTEQDEQETVDAMRALARNLGRQSSDL